MNLRRFQLLAVVLCVFAFSGIMFGQHIVPITVTQVANVGLDTLGYDSTATYCLDLGLGESELPPKPPAGVFDARFVDHRDPPCMGQGQRLHLQGAALDTFQLSFQKGDGAYSFVISWPAGLDSDWDALNLYDGLTGTFISVNMLTSTQVTVTLTFVSSVNIIGAPKISAVAPDNDLIPGTFALNQNYPNPFNPSTTIKFSVAKSSFADVAVFDVLGRRIATLASEEMKPGFYTTTWNGADDNGVAVSSGVYYVRMVATGGQNVNFSAVQKLLLMK